MDISSRSGERICPIWIEGSSAAGPIDVAACRWIFHRPWECGTWNCCMILGMKELAEWWGKNDRIRNIDMFVLYDTPLSQQSVAVEFEEGGGAGLYMLRGWNGFEGDRRNTARTSRTIFCCRNGALDGFHAVFTPYERKKEKNRRRCRRRLRTGWVSQICSADIASVKIWRNLRCICGGRGALFFPIISMHRLSSIPFAFCGSTAFLPSWKGEDVEDCWPSKYRGRSYLSRIKKKSY
jgi:hypothetical protein